MINILLIGPPGVGKGTQASFVVGKYNLNYITTGNLLRREASLQTDLGKKISNVISKGELVSNDIVEVLLENELTDVSKGILFDGYPRNIDQVFALNKILSKINKKLDIVVNMSLDDEVLIKRISGRYVCSQCGAVYNKYFVNPQTNGVCDHCNGNDFITRSDDSENVIKKRLTIFHNENDAIVNYYRSLGVLIDIDCKGSVNEISQEFSKVIDCLKEKV
ncbi:MAG: adenylate kinase [Alphaproteobacteria bacterium]|jgi:adenylate kinase